MINENGLKQLISSCTTDNGTLIDHLYTNLNKENVQAGTLETYFSDHKAIWASVKVSNGMCAYEEHVIKRTITH